MNIAVVDPNGDLIYFARMDGAISRRSKFLKERPAQRLVGGVRVAYFIMQWKRAARTFLRLIRHWWLTQADTRSLKTEKSLEELVAVVALAIRTRRMKVGADLIK